MQPRQPPLPPAPPPAAPPPFRLRDARCLLAAGEALLWEIERDNPQMEYEGAALLLAALPAVVPEVARERAGGAVPIRASLEELAALLEEACARRARRLRPAPGLPAAATGLSLALVARLRLLARN